MALLRHFRVDNDKAPSPPSNGDMVLQSKSNAIKIVSNRRGIITLFIYFDRSPPRSPDIQRIQFKIDNNTVLENNATRKSTFT